MFLRIANVALIATFFGGHITFVRTNEAFADEPVAASITGKSVTEQPLTELAVTGNQVTENPINEKPAGSAARAPLATPPSDLLYESIRSELSVTQDPRSQSTDIRPWTAVESLLKVARKIDMQAAKLEALNNSKTATLLREKSLVIREIAVELLLLMQNRPSN